MARGKSVTLKGDAANALINSLMGKQPEDDDERLLRVATLVHAAMSVLDARRAKLIIKSVAERGLDATLEQMEKRSV